MGTDNMNFVPHVGLSVGQVNAVLLASGKLRREDDMEDSQAFGRRTHGRENRGCAVARLVLGN